MTVLFTMNRILAPLLTFTLLLLSIINQSEASILKLHGDNYHDYFREAENEQVKQEVEKILSSLK